MTDIENATRSESPVTSATKRSNPFRFSLFSLSMFTLLVCVFFAGRASVTRQTPSGPTDGPCTVQCPGAQPIPLKLNDLGDHRYDLKGSQSCVFVGQYVFVDGQLRMEKPVDDRYQTLVWQRRPDDSFVLTEEPLDYPSGGRYAGTVLLPGAPKE